MDFIAINVKKANHEDRSSVSEIGIAIVKDSEIKDSKNWLVRPKDNYYDEVSLYYSNVKPEMTEDAPSFKEVWKEVQPYLEGNIVIARYAPNDIYVIKDALLEAELGMPNFSFYSLHSAIKYSLPDLPSSGLYDACKDLNISDEEPKRAKEDAILCAKVLLELAKKKNINDVKELYDGYRIVAGFFSASEGFKSQYRKNKSKPAKKKQLQPADPSKYDEDNYFCGKNVVVTGDFRTTIHKRREQIEQDIINVGGIIKGGISSNVDILVVGQQTAKNIKEGISQKQRDAIDLIKKGGDIEILVEEDFWTQMYKH